MTLGVPLCAIGLFLVIGCVPLGRRAARQQERLRGVWWTPFRGRMLVAARTIFIAIFGVLVLAVGVAALISGSSEVYP